VLSNHERCFELQSSDSSRLFFPEQSELEEFVFRDWLCLRLAGPANRRHPARPYLVENYFQSCQRAKAVVETCMVGKTLFKILNSREPNEISYMKFVADKEFWDRRNSFDHEELFKNYRYFADDILQRTLTYDPSLSFVEVGCVPGRNMVYFAHRFGYQVSGLDYSQKLQAVAQVLRKNGIEEFELFQCALSEFRPHSKFDIVFSAGFVEHFTDPELVFKQHCDLLKSGGVLIVSLPNFRNGQKLLRVIFGARSVFDWHNLDVMLPKMWGGLAEKHGFSILYCDYVGTFRFWLPPAYNKFLRRLVGRLSQVIERGLRVLNLDQVSNRYFSPQILLVAKKGLVAQSQTSKSNHPARSMEF
jgi:2-polyprenyl-3-methyl-5-hydroxy-6-metoxy-1,4-benzoquinol methylase